MATSRKISTGPGGKGDLANIVVPDAGQLPYPYLWAAGIPALSTTTPGTDVACSNGDFYYAMIFIPTRVEITGATNLIGSVGGTDKVIYYLWDATGAVLASTAVAGVIVGTAATLQTRIPFIDPITIDGPGRYFVGAQFNGTTAKFRAHAIGNHPTGSTAGTFGTGGAITPPTTFTADKGPVICLY
jgi:hypothetical protein